MPEEDQSEQRQEDVAPEHDAGGHVYEMITAVNFAPGNAVMRPTMEESYRSGGVVPRSGVGWISVKLVLLMWKWLQFGTNP